MFGAFDALYGVLWQDFYKDFDTAKEGLIVWSKYLAPLSSADIDKGIQACVESGEKYPPTLPVFYARCTYREPYRASARLEFR